MGRERLFQGKVVSCRPYPILALHLLAPAVKGDHTLYFRFVAGRKRVAPIDMGQKEFSPAYVIRIFRQFGFTDTEIERLLGR